MFWKRKKKMAANEFADLLFEEMVIRIDDQPLKELQLSAVMRERFETKLKLYQLAVVLMALRAEESSNSRLVAVREHFENNIHHLNEVKAAMQELGELLTKAQEPKPMSWARRWLQGLGINETNPITLMHFAHRWTSRYVAVVNTLRECAATLEDAVATTAAPRARIWN
jgi:hypothetical protein